MKASGSTDRLRAGAFVAVGIFVFVVAVFVLGKKSALFSPTDRLYVTFAEVNGLVVGAPVRLAGLEVGSVSAISFPEDLKDKRARVRLDVRSRYMARIRGDSRAFIDSNGLLGDKIINISLGDPGAAQLHDGDTLKAGESITFEAITGALQETITTVKGAVQKAELLLEDAQEQQLSSDLKRITASLANVLEEVESGKGSAHQLIYESRHAEELSLTLREAASLAGRANHAIARVDRVLMEVEQGEGGMHELVYGQAAANAVSEVARAAHEISAVVHDVRDGSGLAHSLIYDEHAATMMAELDELARTLNRMASEMDKGRGTIGALIKDPTVYEDLKTVLGNVKRNILFKALIRATIENDDLRKTEKAPVIRRAEAPPRAATAPQAP